MRQLQKKRAQTRSFVVGPWYRLRPNGLELCVSTVWQHAHRMRACSHVIDTHNSKPFGRNRYQGHVGAKRLAEALRRGHTGEVNVVDAPLAEAAVVGSRITWTASAAEAARLRRRTIIIRMPPGTSRNWSTAHVCQMCCVESCVMFVGA